LYASREARRTTRNNVPRGLPKSIVAGLRGKNFRDFGEFVLAKNLEIVTMMAVEALQTFTSRECNAKDGDERRPVSPRKVLRYGVWR
jgi:hypothetical protein